MNFLNRTKQFILEADMFAYPISLRHRDGSDRKSFVGAILSLIVVVLCTYLFYKQVLAVFQKTDNTINTYYNQDDPPTLLWVPTFIFNFAVQIEGVNMFDQLKYFDVNFYGIMKINQTLVNTFTYPLVPCNESYWSYWGFDFQYKNNNFQNWYCLPTSLYLKLQGKPSASEFDYCELRVTKCTSNCQPQSAIDALLSNNNNMIPVNFYFVNMVMNSQSVYTPYFDDSQSYKINPNSIALNVEIYLAGFSLQTDQSIMPWFDYNVSAGGIIDIAKIKKDTISVYNDTYLTVKIKKSSRSIYMTQVYVKITDILSYIGGLISLITGFVQFFIIYYNQVCFYIDLGEDIFQLNPNHDKEPQVHGQNFNFLYYLVYMLNRQLNKIRLSLGWRKIDKYKEVVEQVQENIDIKLLLQKLMYLERVVDVLLTEEQQKLLHKYNKETIQYSKLRREIFMKEENHQQTQMKIFSINDNPDNPNNEKKDQIKKKIIQNQLIINSIQDHYSEAKTQRFQNKNQNKQNKTNEVFQFTDYHEEPNLKISYVTSNSKL